MATFIFTKNIIDKRPIKIFNFGKMKRDFTYIDDIVEGIYGAILSNKKITHKIYNLGNNKPEKLNKFIELIESSLKIDAKKKLLPIQPGDVPSTFADIAESKKDLNFQPKVGINEGVPKFVEWFKKYYEVP